MESAGPVLPHPRGRRPFLGAIAQFYAPRVKAHLLSL